MPLYQEPAVYIEEQQPATTTIPAASTTIAGFVGWTERGPLRPQLISGPDAFRRTFGGWMPREEFTHNGRAHHFMPLAVAGFFLNQGQLAYVVRVVPDTALRSAFALADTGQGLAGAETRLLFAAPQGTGTGLNPPLAYVLESTNLAVGDRVQIGEGSGVENHVIAEIRDIAAVVTGLAHLPLATALDRTLAAGVTAQTLTRAADAATFAGGSGGVFDLDADAAAGATEFMLATATDADAELIGPGVFLEIGGDVAGAEIVEATAAAPVGPGRWRITLADPLQADAAAATGTIQALDRTGITGDAAPLARDAAAGTSLVALDGIGALPNLRTAGELVLFSAGGTAVAIRRIADLGLLRIDAPAYIAYESGTRIRRVNAAPLAREAVAGGTDTTFGVDETEGLIAGLPVVVFAGGSEQAATIAAVDAAGSAITLAAALPAAPAAGDTVTPAYALTADAAAGTVVIALNARLGLDPTPEGERRLLRLGTPPDDEYLEIAELAAPRGVAPDAGAVLLAHRLAAAYPAGTPVRLMTEPVADPDAGRPSLVLDAPAGALELPVTGGPEFLADDIVRVDLPTGATAYHRLGAGFDGSIEPAQVTLQAPTLRAQPAGAGVAERAPLLDVVARDQGSAGSRIRVAVEREGQGLLANASVTAQPAADQIRLDTVTGLYEGSVLEFVDPVTGAVQGPPAWVLAIDRANANLITLGADLDALNLPVVGAVARSVEYRISLFDTARLVPGRPAPANPVVDTEVFTHVSLNPLHPRYAETLIGTPDGPEDPVTGLSMGASRLVRVEDLAPTPLAAVAVRAFALHTDTLPSGIVRPARHPLAGGTDDIALVDDQLYQGTASNDPDERTGIEALRNAPNVSMIAAPGQATVGVANRLIQQAEELGDRFALLDPPETATRIADVRTYRQFFDTSYAAMSYPWLRVLDLAPGATEAIAAPPSGHVAGLYARTDIRRGVFKPPANEVVMGIVGIAQHLTGPEHGLLNADDTQVNVIRRYEERGTRLMGARTISSEAFKRYVNVRRLLISYQVALERGLQSQIFEPNDPRLWGRITRTISTFLENQWRIGALLGATPQEAFVVRCDQSTMTEDDILNGRLICIVGVAPVRPAEFIIIKLFQQVGLSA